MQTVKTISIKANEKDVTLLEKLMELLEKNQTAVIREAIRKLARSKRVA